MFHVIWQWKKRFPPNYKMVDLFYKITEVKMKQIEEIRKIKEKNKNFHY